MSGFLDGKKITVQPDCYPCFLRQTVIALGYGGADDKSTKQVIKAVLKDIANAAEAETPAHATTFMHRTIRELLGKDPFLDIKRKYNGIALGLYPDLKKLINNSRVGKPLLTASRLAIAGNVIDFGIFTSVDIEGTVRRALDEPLAIDDYEAFREAIENTPRVLYLLDNAGEAVFDRLLIETLMAMGKEVTAVAKGSPVINDCTIEDALDAGLPCELIGNGSDAVGTILQMTNEGFRRRYEAASLIISKGQGNFETLLGETPGRIFYLFQSKCDVVSKALGIPKGSMLLAKQ